MSQISSPNITISVLKTSQPTDPRPQNTPKNGKTSQLTGISMSKNHKNRLPNNEGTTTLLTSSPNPSTQGFTTTTKATSPTSPIIIKIRSNMGPNIS